MNSSYSNICLYSLGSCNRVPAQRLLHTPVMPSDLYPAAAVMRIVRPEEKLV